MEANNNIVGEVEFKHKRKSRVAIQFKYNKPFVRLGSCNDFTVLQLNFTLILRKSLYIVTVTIFKEYLIVTVTIFKKYLIVTLKKLKF